MLYFSEPMKLLIYVQYSGEKAMSHPQTESLSYAPRKFKPKCAVKTKTKTKQRKNKKTKTARKIF